MVAVALAGVAWLLAVARAVQVLRVTRVSAKAFAVQLAKLCRAGNVERAMKLCEAGGELLVTEVMGAGIRELMRVRTAEAADAGFEGRRVEWLGSLARGRWLARVAMAAAAVAAILAVAAPELGGLVGRGRTGEVIALVLATTAALKALWSVAAERRALVALAAAWQGEVMPALRAGVPWSAE